MIARRSLLKMSVALMTLPVLNMKTARAANRVEVLKTAKGIEVWLVRQSNLPVIAMDWALRGGATQEPDARAGLASMTASLLDEGAGDLDMEAFQKRIDEYALQISFSAGRDNFGGSLKALSTAKDEAFTLLGLALSSPRFDAGPVERVRQQILSGIRRSSTNPNAIASELFWATAFPGHPYGRRTSGTAETVTAITQADLKGFMNRIMARDSLKIAVVGDITPEEVVRLVDRAFGHLPEKASLTPVPDVTMQGVGERKLRQLEVPQTVITFGMPGFKRSDPDFIPAFVTNHVLGGGSFTSRLYTEVREKRGLTYGVSSGLSPLDATGMLTGGTSTRNDKAAETVAIIAAEIKRMAEGGPSEEELASAKRYLIGSWAMRFETSNAIAANLLRLQLDGFQPDYLDKRNTIIDAVTLDDARRATRRLLGDGRMLVVAVGKPEGF